MKRIVRAAGSTPGRAGAARVRGTAVGFRAALAAGAVAAAILLDPGATLEAKKKKDAPQPSPEEVYQQALARIDKKKYYKARTMLQQVLPRIPPEDRDLLPRAQLAIADAFFLDKGYLNYGEALNGFRNFLTYYPQHPEADRAQYMVGMCLFMQAPAPDRDQSVTRQAIAEFGRLETLHPGSPYYPKARDRIREAHDRLADHELLVGNFYRQRRAWRAATKRYADLLDLYPHYARASRALYELVRCYLALGDRTRAEETFARLPADPRTKDEKRDTEEARRAMRKYDEEMKKLAGKGRRK
jgi:outer membrane protein assembly factor BamD